MVYDPTTSQCSYDSFPARRSRVVLGMGLTLLTVLLSPPAATAHYLQPDLEQIPVHELIANIERQLAVDPGNVELRMNLGRVYAMAWTNADHQWQLLKSRDKDKPNTTDPWFGYEPPHLPFAKGEPGRKSEHESEGQSKESAEYLAKAIAAFEQVVKQDPDNLTAQLSLAWCRDKNDDSMAAMSLYRQVIEEGWEKEKDMTAAGLGFHSIVAEAAGYLKSHLDPKADTEELADLDTKLERINKIARPITPIAIPLGQGTRLVDVIDRNATVTFDADGSGIAKSWSWIQADAGWLVYDRKGNGRIESGLQLFGSVSFWCFWQHGYAAMAGLDANGDGHLTGEELQHLRVWIDENCNGVSDVEEVHTLASLGIESLSCTAAEFEERNSEHTMRRGSDANCQHWNEAGVRFVDGTTRPTYDVILHPGANLNAAMGGVAQVPDVSAAR